MTAVLPRMMTVFAAAVALSAAGTAPARAQVEPVAAAQVAPADAYADDRTRELVDRARARRAMYDSRITAYSATAVERLSIGLRAGIAQRLVYRRETASHIDWTLDTVRIEVLGAREVGPPFSAAVGIPGDLEDYMPSLAFDPVDSEMMLRLDSTDLRHPLAAGGEQHYRYEAGDSSVITLPDGRTVRLHELRIRPRRRDPQLIVGSFWVDAASHAVVQAYFRQSRGYDLDRQAIEGEGCGVSCRLALAVMPEFSAELDYIAIDYGLWDLQWWMPRSVAARGVMRAGRFSVPVSFERRYSDYTVAGDPAGVQSAWDDGTRTRPCRPPTGMSINIGVGRDAEPDSARLARRDSVNAARRAAREARRAERIAAGDSVPPECDRTFIVSSADADELLTSELLPASIYTGDSGVLDLSELENIAAGLRRIPSVFWQLERPGLQLPSDLRYNRVEGASAAAAVVMDFGRLTADAELGIGSGDRRVRGGIGIERPGRLAHTRLAAHSGLAAMNGTGTPFTLGSTVNALLLGRDEHEYYRTTGLALTVRPAAARTPWYDVRLFAERQRSVEKETDFSVAHLFDENRLFRPNFTADAADQLGATVVLRSGSGMNPRAFRLAAELELHGETGDYDFVRPALRLNTTVPLGAFAFTTELAAGSSFGTSPAQRDWLLGGGATLRGYDIAAARGPAFWRARAELAFGLPFTRIAVFSDIGAAGPRDSLRSARPLRSAGIGLSFFDGLVRLDLARPLDGGRWRLHSFVDGMR